MKNLIIKLVSVLFVCGALTGCGAFGAVVGALPTVISLVQDAILVLDRIDSTARPFFERPENAELLIRYDQKMLIAKKTLQIALRASQGGKELSDEEIDAAFAEFRDAYKDLLSLLRESGFMSDKFRAAVVADAEKDLEIPLAVSRVEK